MIGLADWHIYQHTDGRRTALRQTQTSLALVIERPGAPVEWRRYADVHGMLLEAVGEAQTLEDALEAVQ